MAIYTSDVIFCPLGLLLVSNSKELFSFKLEDSLYVEIQFRGKNVFS